MDEERVTEAVEAHLSASGWTIFAVDYPTSGSGLRIHPTERRAGSKHAGSVVPDIVAYRDETLLVVENKPYVDPADVRKLARIAAGDYDESLERRVYEVEFRTLATAIGIPADAEPDGPLEPFDPIDYLYVVDSEGGVTERRP